MASGFVKAELSTCRHGRPLVTCRLLYKSVLLWVFGLILWKWMNGVDSLGSNQGCRIVYKHPSAEYLNAWQVLGDLEIAEVLRDYVASNPQKEQICLFLSSWLGISKWTQVPGFNVAYAISTVRHRIDFLNVRNAKNASTLHAQTLVPTNS